MGDAGGKDVRLAVTYYPEKTDLERRKMPPGTCMNLSAGVTHGGG